MLNIGQDIHSLTGFQRRTSALVGQLRQTRHSMVLTVNGRPAVVVQEAAAGQELLDHVREPDTGRSEPQQGKATGGRP